MMSSSTNNEARSPDVTVPGPLDFTHSIRKMGPARVAAIIAANEVSGPGRQLVSLAVELAKQGVAFTVLLLNRPGAPTAFADFVRAQGIECRIVQDNGAVDPGVMRAVRQFIADWQPDVVETHGYKPTSVMFALRLLGVRCPWVGFFEGQTDKGFKDRLFHRLDLRMLRAADRVVVMSGLQRKMFPPRADHVRVVANAVPDLSRAKDTNVLPPVLLRKRGSGPVPHVGAIGRLSREKGVDVMLDALALLRARGVGVHGVVVGDGALEGELKAQAGRLGIAEDVTFTGRVDIVREVYEALDLMVIPSRSEGLPSVLLEALPTGLPVVSTRVGAMIEIAAREPDALRVVPIERPELLADAIAAAIEDSASPAAAAARGRVAAGYSIERRAEHMMDIFRQSMASRGAR